MIASTFAAIGLVLLVVGLLKPYKREGDYDLMPVDPAGCLLALVGLMLLLLAAGMMLGRIL